jgi:hypothetical protein
MNSIINLVDEVREMTDNFVAGMRKEPASRLGLDDRCGMLWVHEDAIVAYKGSRVEYYGGFEYVKGDDRAECGDYVVYFATSQRVADAIECLMEFDGECETE